MNREDGSFERRIQSIIQAVITALVLWVGYTTLGVRESSIRLEEQTRQIQGQVGDLKVEVSRLKEQAAIALGAREALRGAPAEPAKPKK